MKLVTISNGDSQMYISFRTDPNALIYLFIICQQYSVQILSCFTKQRIFRTWKCRIMRLQVMVCGHKWLCCFIWRNRRWNRIEFLWRLTASWLLVAHRAMSGSINVKVVTLMWGTKNADAHRKSLKVMNCKHCSIKLMIKRRKNSQNNLIVTSQPLQGLSKPWKWCYGLGDGDHRNWLRDRRKT